MPPERVADDADHQSAGPDRGLYTDVVMFAGGTGTWVFANQRVRVSGTPTLSTTSFGQAVEGMQTGSMTVIGTRSAGG